MIELDFGVIADHAYIEPATGKFYVLGEFAYVRAAQFPHRQRFVLAARWTADSADVRDRFPALQVEVVDEDGHAVMPRTPAMPLTFAQSGPVRYGKMQAQLALTFEALEVPRAGVYAIQCFLDGTARGAVRFYAAGTSDEDGGGGKTEAPVLQLVTRRPG